LKAGKINTSGIGFVCCNAVDFGKAAASFWRWRLSLVGSLFRPFLEIFQRLCTFSNV
jgi:hypothetical protein